MSDHHPEIFLPHGTPHVLTKEIPKLIAEALHPDPAENELIANNHPAQTEEQDVGKKKSQLDEWPKCSPKFEADIRRDFIQMQHKELLKQAIENQEIRQLTIESRVPIITYQEDGVVLIEDFIKYVEKFGIVICFDDPIEESTAKPRNCISQKSESQNCSLGIDRNKVMSAFNVRLEYEENRKFWDDKLGRPPKWLEVARVLRGKPGKSTRWNPLLMAHALLERKEMDIKQLDTVMSLNFKELFQQWKEETEDLR